MLTNKKFIIGPFGGEFGYELCYWIPYVRHFVDKANFITEDVDKDVLCLVQDGREYLYKDVRCRLMQVELNKGHDDWVYNNQDVFWENPEDSFTYFDLVKVDVKNIIGVSPSNAELVLPSKDLWDKPRRWVRYDEFIPQKDRYDVIIHMRNKRDTRDVPKSAWRDIMEFLHDRPESVGIIGTSNDYLPNVDEGWDLRDVPLRDLCHYITQADVCLGAISGPMHLASLCGTEHIVAGNPETPIPEVGTSIEAFQRGWNPFNTRVTYTSKRRFIDTVKDFSISGGE